MHITWYYFGNYILKKIENNVHVFMEFCSYLFKN